MVCPRNLTTHTDRHEQRAVSHRKKGGGGGEGLSDMLKAVNRLAFLLTCAKALDSSST